MEEETKVVINELFQLFGRLAQLLTEGQVSLARIEHKYQGLEEGDDLATEMQLRVIESFGMPIKLGMTREQASRIVGDLVEQGKLK